MAGFISGTAKVIGLVVMGFFALLILGGCLAVMTAGDDEPDTASSPAVVEPAEPGTAPAEPAPAPAAPPVDEAAQNITLDTCDVTDLGGTKFSDIAYTISNPTSKSSDYLFQVAVIDSTGAAVSQSSGFEPNVLPGRPSKGKAMGNVSDSAVGPYTCEVSDVTRIASS